MNMSMYQRIKFNCTIQANHCIRAACLSPCSSNLGKLHLPALQRRTIATTTTVKFCNHHASSSRRYLSSSSGRSVQHRNDPTAKRPNRLCDPYGQGGKPLSLTEVEALMSTISDEWKIEYASSDSQATKHELNEKSEPVALLREFVHDDYLKGARFLHKIAAIAQVNDHFPSSITLSRNIYSKNWQVITTCRCHTTVLGGLSSHDFYLAMLIDVECNRPENRDLLASAPSTELV